MYIVLLPMVVQFFHSIEHSHTYCESQNKLHIDSHKFNCKAFHFKINQESITFFSEKTIDYNPFFIKKNKVYKLLSYITILNKKSSRAPPYLLFS